ncbi:MAG: ATP-binding cassette domain-containing protein [Chloroflexota bacterium]|nr:ATP-binding cassette domain-containing protein [Chloroflexota bacterium]
MSADLAPLIWPPARLGACVGALMCQAGLAPGSAPADPPAATDSTQLEQWLVATLALLGLEAAAGARRYGEVEPWLAGGSPALLRLPDGAGWLLVLGGSRRGVRLLGPAGRQGQATPAVVRHALCAPLEDAVSAGLDRVLVSAGVPPPRRLRVRQALLQDQLAGAPVAGCWAVRLPPGAPFGRQLRRAGLPTWAAAFFALYAAGYGLSLIAWGLIGGTALAGGAAGGLVGRWVVLSLFSLGLTVASGWAAGRLALGTGRLLKRRLLAGALQLDTDSTRRQGAGMLLGRVFESEAVESLALSGGLLGGVAALELLAGAATLLAGAGGGLPLALLILWLAVLALAAQRLVSARRQWTGVVALGSPPLGSRLGLTHALIERMVGYRTWLAQEPRAAGNSAGESAVADYRTRSLAMDQAALGLNLIPSGWLVLGLLGLAPALVTGTTVGSLALGVAGLLLVERALTRAVAGLNGLADAAIAWQGVAPLFHAAVQPAECRDPAALLPTASPSDRLLDAQDLSFAYQPAGVPVLQGCSLRVAPGDRILLEGASGGGKSTLVAVLTGLRVPQRGRLSIGGHTLAEIGGSGWRRRVVAAPQFHENHLFTDTLAFNLLLGRRWPPTAADLTLAATLCRELGLGDLLDRMPAGLQQVVGETGRQLSQGERSRVYIARALLQEADLILLDESFGSLDPETLRLALYCVLQRAPALLVIAHP